MKYDGRKPGNGWWNCPFSPEWVECTKRAVKVCERLSSKKERADLDILDEGPSLKFLNEEQDSRGLPMSLCKKFEERYADRPNCCVATYDYDSLPDVVISDSEGDRPLRIFGKILTA